MLLNSVRLFLSQELQLSLKNLAERLLPWKPVRLEEVVTAVGLIEFVDSLVWEEDENEMTRRVASYSLYFNTLMKSYISFPVTFITRSLLVHALVCRC